jgi:C-terminal AAA-associated domain
VPIVALIKPVLDERPSHRAPFSRFSEQLEDFMSEEAVKQTLRLAITWGRYAELFAYNEETRRSALSLPKLDGSVVRRLGGAAISPRRRPSDLEGWVVGAGLRLLAAVAVGCLRLGTAQCAGSFFVRLEALERHVTGANAPLHCRCGRAVELELVA